MKRDKTKPAATKPARAVTRWQKSCPKCNVTLHVRKKVCECGHEFSVQAGSARGESRPK
jgi:rRNA maturation endonuclease Nob1